MHGRDITLHTYITNPLTYITIIKMNSMSEKLGTEVIERNRQEFVALLQSTGRKGVEAVLGYLDGVGFYTAPSSIDRHHNWRGGLAQHSLETCRLALADRGSVARESVIIAALLHDVCKASRLYYGADGRIHHRSTRIKGHGYRSLALLEREGLELTAEERLAIRWHMGTRKATPEVAGRVRHSRLCTLVYVSDKLDAKRGH